VRKVEIIPDNDKLFRRIHISLYNEKKRKFSEPAFMVRDRRNEKALSVNWEKYASAEQTSYDPYTKKNFCVGGIIARIPRKLNLEVIHKPTRNNIAHSIISGNDLLDNQKRYEIAGHLADACEPLIIIYS